MGPTPSRWVNPCGGGNIKRLKLSRALCSRCHRPGRLSKQDFPLFFCPDPWRIWIDFFGKLIGALCRWTCLDALKPALEMRKLADILALSFVRHNPRIRGHVRNGIIAGDELSIGESLVQHAVKAISFLDISIDCVRDFLHCVIPKMVVLARHGTKAAHLP